MAPDMAALSEALQNVPHRPRGGEDDEGPVPWAQDLEEAERQQDPPVSQDSPVSPDSTYSSLHSDQEAGAEEQRRKDFLSVRESDIEKAGKGSFNLRAGPDNINRQFLASRGAIRKDVLKRRDEDRKRPSLAAGPAAMNTLGLQ